MNPTAQLYQSLEVAYQFFNEQLFDKSLPNVIFTVQRQKGVMGYFAPERWGTLSGESCHEIAINPSYIAQSRTIEVLQTLVHEMVHCWQFCHGEPGRKFYHNKEWAFKMIEVGLMPSSTGEPGGHIVGQQMSDYVLADGKFYLACDRLLSNESFRLNWVDRKALPRLFHPLIINSDDAIFPEGASKPTMLSSPPINSDLGEEENFEHVMLPIVKSSSLLMETPFSELVPAGFLLQEQMKKPKRYRYVCPGCDVKIYGKPNLKVRCEECDERFVWTSYETDH